MSDLGMNGASFNDPLASPVNQSCYSPQEDLPSAVGIETDSHSRSGGDDGTAAYSPSSTVSPGPHAQDANPTAVPISRSSELAYALHVEPDQVFESGRGKLTSYSPDAPDAEADAPGASRDITPYFFPQEQGPSASSNSPMGAFADKFGFDSEMNPMSPDGHYHPSYTSTGDNQYNPVGSFATSEGQEELGIHHQIEFAQSDVYPAFNGGSVDPSSVTSIENNLCAVEGFPPYS
jgi:hypothetical protein